MTAAASTVAAGTGTRITADGATIPAAYPVTPGWVPGPKVAIGSGPTAARAASRAGDTAIFDPVTGILTGLAPGSATLTLTAASATPGASPVRASVTVTITVPVQGGDTPA